MIYLYYGILAAVFFATFAMLIDKGLWSNALTTINVLLSGLVAFGFYMPVARLASENGMESFTYLLDFISLWLLFTVSIAILHQVLSGLLSGTQMRFKHPIDTVGGPVMAAAAGWLMTGLVAATLHAAPFDKDCLGEAFTREPPMVNPDRFWLGMTENLLSEGHLGTSGASFSQEGYISNFGKQREALEKEEGLLAD